MTNSLEERVQHELDRVEFPIWHMLRRDFPNMVVIVVWGKPSYISQQVDGKMLLTMASLQETIVVRKGEPDVNRS